MKRSSLPTRLGVGAIGLFLVVAVCFSGGIAGMAEGTTTFPVAPSTPSATSPAPPSGGDLTIPEIGSLASAAGFRGSALAMAIAVALAESSGNPNATNYDSNGTVDRGVWQINSVHVQYSASCDYDPTCAAGAAFAISAGGTNWGAWVTYQHGAEIVFLPETTAYAEAQGDLS